LEMPNRPKWKMESPPTKLLLKLADVPTPAGPTQRQIGSGLVQITVSRPAVQSVVPEQIPPALLRG
jgi:hypothetical protein